MVLAPKPGGNSLLCPKTQWGFSGSHRSWEVPRRQLTVHNQLEVSATKYKEAADNKWQEKVFNEGNLMMVYLWKGRFPMFTCNKLKDKKYGPYQIIKNIIDNAFVVELLANMAIYFTFNVANVLKYFPPDEPIYPQPNLRTSSFEVGGTDVK